ncbi:MAG: hypothetical protein IJA30_02160 [Bacilli bacterium]|nr:hypothetical protein [Bacilli bacterium]
MQLLFVILFGVVVSFILYLSYHTHVVEKTENKLQEKKEVIETKKDFKEENLEKVEDKKEDIEVVEIVKFKAKRNKKTIEEDEEEII